MSYVALLDPSLRDNDNNPAKNLGDIVISRAIKKQLNNLFPNLDIVSISSHAELSDKSLKLLKEADYSFIGGTNLLTSYHEKFNMPLRGRQNSWFRPGVSNLILFGVGWGWGYGEPITPKTQVFYKKLLRKSTFHAVRDQYSADKLGELLPTLNTNCPTLWELNGTGQNLDTLPNHCLTTVTDYSRDLDTDGSILKLLTERFKSVTIFLQGSNDLDYLESIPFYVSNKNLFELLEHEIKAFDDFVEDEDFVYVGSRLHGGIRCLQAGKKAFILGVDNRALEIAKDTGLCVVNRGDYSKLNRWLNGEEIFDDIHLNIEDIEKFKSQFK